MAAVALPIALLLGMLIELLAGLVSWAFGGDRRWWGGVSGIWSDTVRATSGARERVSAVEAGGAAASMLGAGVAAAGALDVAPDDLVLMYLALALASAGAMVAGWELEGRTRRRFAAALAEAAFAVAVGALFLRYGALDLDAVRGTQQILGTGLVLGPPLAVVGLVAAAKAVAWAAVLRLPSLPEEEARGQGDAPEAGPALLVRLCRWSLFGATSLLAGVLLAGGAVEPFSTSRVLPLAAGAGGFALAVALAEGIARRLPDRWRSAVSALTFVVASAGAALGVLT